MNNMSKDNGLGKFIAGVAIGAAAGILLAPKSGEETRKDLKKKFDELVNNIKGIEPSDVKEYFEKQVENIKKEIKEFDKEKAIKAAKEKANKIKKDLDKLLKEAKEKATPVIQESVSKLRTNTIKVLKNTVEKLEEAENSK
jgi:gas vesicle protein